MEPKQLGANEASGVIATERVITIYVCPKCPNYFGSSSMGNLESQVNDAPVGAKNESYEPTPRSRCPDCGENRVKQYARLVPQNEVADAVKKIRAEIERTAKAVAL